MSARPPEPTSRDLAAWRRLTKAAQAAALDPGAACGDLAQAERSAKRCIVLGVLTRENPCVVLVRLARRFSEATLRERRDLASALAAATQGVEAAIDDLQPSRRRPVQAASAAAPPVTRHRADIDG